MFFISLFALSIGRRRRSRLVVCPLRRLNPRMLHLIIISRRFPQLVENQTELGLALHFIFNAGLFLFALGLCQQSAVHDSISVADELLDEGELLERQKVHQLVLTISVVSRVLQHHSAQQKMSPRDKQ